jgi:hypothetical protein
MKARSRGRRGRAYLANVNDLLTMVGSSHHSAATYSPIKIKIAPTHVRVEG